MPLFSEDHKSGWRLSCWWRTFAWECSKAWEMLMQSRSTSALFCTQMMISVSVHTLTDSFTGIPKTTWAFSYPKTLFVGDPLPEGLLQNPVYAVHPQHRSKGALALPTWITLCPCEGWGSLLSLSVRELCCLPDLWQLLWVFSSCLANLLQISGLGLRALGLDVWLLTGRSLARFQVQGKSRTKGTSKYLRELLIPLTPVV